MSHQFNPGDLALIVSCGAPDLIGRTVELTRRLDPGEIFETSEVRWINNSMPSWLVAGEDLFRKTVGGALRPSNITLIGEHKLMPLRGDFQPERQQSREVPA